MSYRLNPIFPGITFYICLILILTSPLSAFGQGGMTPNPFIELEYGYDPTGNVTSIVNHIDPGRSSFMQYDALDRLAGTRGQWGRINYRYDSVGNRVEKDVNGEIVGYRYRGANNQLGSVVHDRNGNIIEDEKHRYVYDSENRLIEVWSGDHRVAAYKYDAFGRRISKTDSSGNTTYYAYGEGLEVLTEFKENALPEHDYIYAGNSRVARVDFDGSGFHEDTFFYHTDHIGSSISVTDRITDQVWDNEYLPYGDSAKEQIHGFTDVDHQFSSKELDENTGLYYFGARYYNPGIGRFMSVDPAGIDITNPQSWNRYAYVRNNPYTYVDPDGRQLVRFNSEEDAENFDPTSLAGPLSVVNTVKSVGFRLFRKVSSYVKSNPKSISNTVVNNPIPERVARVIDLRYKNSPTIGSPMSKDVFVTAERDIRNVKNSLELADKLTLVDEKGNFLLGPYAIFEFDTPKGIATPVFRNNPGFVGFGKTQGGAVEYVVPNLKREELNNLNIRIIK